MKSPNWQEARTFVDLIAGATDPAMTFQVFDDKAERYDLAGWRHGKLTDPAIRKWLTSRADQGCGVYVTVSACDGKGRRRANVKYARALFIDLDGEPLPDAWPPGMKPDIINETSPGKYHCFWLIQNEEDLNAFSDTQSRLAHFYGADLKVFDPPRVVRLPGFYHQKNPKKVFRSRTLETSDRDPQFDRFERETVADAHVCDYASPAERADNGRSEDPVDGWDNEADVARARDYLAKVEPPKPGNRNNSGYRVAAVLNDYGISPELSFELMAKIWNERLDEPLKDHEIQHVIKSAGRYKASSAGSDRVIAAEDEFDEPVDIAEELPEKLPEKFDFEGQATGKTKEFDFETPSNIVKDEISYEDPDDPATKVKDRPKTIKRETGGVSWSYGSEIRAEALSWLWPNRIPRGKLTIIAGFPDQGKSQILLACAAAVSNGSEWPNREGIAPKGVAIIMSSEDDEADTLIPRLAAAGANLDNIIIIRSMVKVVVEGKKRKRVLNIEDDLQNIFGIMKQVHATGRHVRMIGMDPINAYLGGGKKADAHKNSDMRALLTPIAEWAAMLKVAIIAISHFNKGGNSHTLYRVTDSGAITAAARSVYFALKKPVEEGANKNDPVERIFVSGKHNLAPDAVKALSYTIDGVDVSEKTGVPNQVMPAVTFGGEDEMTADEAMAGISTKTRGRPSANDEAIEEFLTAEFKDGPVEVRALEAAAKAAGIPIQPMHNKARRMGCRSERQKKFGGKFAYTVPIPAKGADVGDDFEGDAEDADRSPLADSDFG